jgi:hypothetical protein
MRMIGDRKAQRRGLAADAIEKGRRDELAEGVFGLLASLERSNLDLASLHQVNGVHVDD